MTETWFLLFAGALGLLSSLGIVVHAVGLVGQQTRWRTIGLMLRALGIAGMILLCWLIPHPPWMLGLLLFALTFGTTVGIVVFVQRRPKD